MIPAVNVSQIAGGQKVAGALTSWQVPNGPDIVEHLGGVSPDGDVLVFFWSLAHDSHAMNLSLIASGHWVVSAPTYTQGPSSPHIWESLRRFTRHCDPLASFSTPAENC